MLNLLDIWGERPSFGRGSLEHFGAVPLHVPRELLQAPPMFVIELTYKAPLEQIDAHMKAHVAFLKKYYTAGHFLVSGRQIPREGGIILAQGESKDQIRAIVEEDPFVRQKLAEYRIVEFRASQRADDIPKRMA